ncbi:MAG: 1-(5-phosphoribosyl)-5-[(5-phosphoribosylamino)methylideneamino]imidazole-4-carboxamide isomerase, partial [Chitinophagaceae bacterium]
SYTSLTVDFGGGITAEEDVRIVFESGAAYATIGSIAVKDPVMFTNWLSAFGAAKFLLGADVRDKKIAIHGWQEMTSITVFDFIEQYQVKGIEQVFCTDIQKDGKLDGPSTDLYKEIIERFPNLFFIASGGVSSLDDLFELKDAGCRGAIIGKAIYENRISLEELKSFL